MPLHAAVQLLPLLLPVMFHTDLQHTLPVPSYVTPLCDALIKRKDKRMGMGVTHGARGMVSARFDQV